MVLSETQQLEILYLPAEIQLQILDYLDFRNRITASRVCGLWNALSFTGRFMDRICLYLNVTANTSRLVLSVLGTSSRRYRHITINFNNETVLTMEQLTQFLCINDGLQSLALAGMAKFETGQLLNILESVPNLERLFLVYDGINDLQRTHILEFPKSRIVTTTSEVRPSTWPDSLSVDTSLVLKSLHNLCLITPPKLTPTLESLQHFFPNINQLQLSTCHASLVTVFQNYQNQLKKISILSPAAEFFVLFCDLGFPKLTYLFLDRMELHSQDIVGKCIDFFKNPAQSNALQQLLFHPKFMIRTPIFTTICSTCWALRELALSLDYLDGDALKDVTNLQHLQKLSLQGTAYFRETPHWPYQISTLTEAKISGSRYPATLLEFISDIARNLETLSLEDLENPEEMFRILPDMLGSITHLEMGYSEAFERPPTCHPSGFLRSMVNLETYYLRRVIIKHGIQGWLQDAPHLRCVMLASCASLTDTHLVILTTNCPKLRQLELKDCAMVTAKGVDDFRTRIPLCRIIDDIA